MAEYIEREALLKVLRGSAVAKYPASFAMGLFAAADEVSKLPAADVVPVVRGRWEVHPKDTHASLKHLEKLRCTHCWHFFYHDCGDSKNYCPNCGCHMDGGNE